MKSDLLVKLYWTSILRWIAIFFQSALLLLGVRLGYVEAANIPFYLLIVFFLIIINLRVVNNFLPLGYKLVTLLIWDTLSFTGLIYLSGKMENPFWALIYLHAGISAILLPRNQEKIYLPFLILSMFSIHYASYSYHTAIFYVLIPQWIILTTTWVLTRLLGNLLARQRELLSKLEMKNQKIQKMKSVGALSSGILHEIGTPLNTLRLKLDKFLDSSHDENILIMDKTLTQCETIIEKLNLAQQEMATKIISSENLFKLFDEYLEKKHTEIKIENNISHKVYVKVAKTNLTLIFDIILENAKEVGVKQIKASIKEAADYISFILEDDGPGFSSFVLQNIGAPYTSTKGRGRGLGLYTAQMSLESMGGELSISNTDHGAINCLKLVRDPK